MCSLQSEAGMRDIGVTGVQTCSVPIFLAAGEADHHAVAAFDQPEVADRLADEATQALAEFVGFEIGAARVARDGHAAKRSEERRVGKECRSRWSPDH